MKVDKQLSDMAMAAYVGESCKYCGFTANCVQDLDDKNVKWVGYHSKGRWACGLCFDLHADSDPDNPKNKEK